MGFRHIFITYLENSSLHGARFTVEKENHFTEKLFWVVCITLAWIASGFLIMSAWDAFQHNAIQFVVETSYRDWDTDFPAIAICESKNMDRVSKVSEQLWGSDHDFTLEEVLSEIAYFRGESYHTVHECYADDEGVDNCLQTNFSYYASLVRSSCKETLDLCWWNDIQFDCCEYFHPMETELGLCYAINSNQVRTPKAPRFPMRSNKYTGPGSIKIQILIEANVYVIGEEDVPNLVTSKSDILAVGPYISYLRKISVRNIENDPLTRSVSVEQRNCRFHDEHSLDVHTHYSYSACSVQCRKDKQLELCDCVSHLMPNTDPRVYCNMSGLICLNENYEELSVVIPKWSKSRKGVICDCMPSCTEIDVSLVHDSRNNIMEHQRPMSLVEIGLINLPTEKYKRNVVRGKLDLVVSFGGSASLFLGCSLLSFVEVVYYFFIRPYGLPADDIDNNTENKSESTGKA
ncbi:sodium channel protein Nach [Bradysia coprophila]|uniref:sodium channel protein Nach n=1 Tax=Bradysia coprophila TaxID=38358 RepID=UPI00187DD701|nr:sodium channel protein Nach [Bradysia coprophila]